MIKRELIAGALAAMLLSGCGLIYKPTGEVLNHYTQDEAVPYALASGDLDKTTCGTGLALGQLIGSFSRVIARPSMTLLSTNTLAALCSGSQAQQAHLKFERALYYDHPGQAQDYRIIAKRLERRTALRRYQVYRDTENAYGELGAEPCPDLDNELGTDTDRLQYLVGILTSVQGLLNDLRSGTSVGIPQNVAAKAARASRCLDNRKWWGVPDALQAVVWLSVPGLAPDDAKPWAQLRQAVAIGEAQGMALTPMLYALAAQNQSDTEREKTGIKHVASTYKKDSAPREYQILNEVAYSQALYFSDRLWMQNKGHRTPFASLGTFPGEDKSSGSKINANDYL